MYDTLSECLWELLLQDFHPPLTSRPPQRPAWMPSALRPSHNSGILPRAIRTLIGRRNNRPSLRAMPPCDTSLLTGRHPYQTTSCFPSHQRPSFSEIQELTGKSRLHTTDDGTVLLVREPTPQPPLDQHRPVLFVEP